MITYLSINDIFPHPNNPRNNLGDLSELVDSIKANGIMQNLTVVRQQWSVNDTKPIKYTAVIGHRRLAAAKEAGLEEVPCVISEMSEKQQIATMLLENMQRSDLTVYEQAQGMQMMIDLGESINDISAKTGFSESTVRRRVKLMDLDQDKLQESVARGGTLQDYAELDKIKNAKTRNKVLGFIGTRDFEFQLKKAIDDEEYAINKTALISILNTFAVETKDTNGLSYVAWISYEKDTYDVPADAGTRKYFYSANTHHIQLYAERLQEHEQERVLSPEEIERNKRRDAITAISKRAFELRYEFLKCMYPTQTQTKGIYEFIIRNMVNAYRFDDSAFADILGIECDGELEFEDVSDLFCENPLRMLLAAAYCSTEDDDRESYFKWNGEYKENSELDALYELINSLGYQMSMEEEQLRSGTHELFVQEDPADDE